MRFMEVAAKKAMAVVLSAAVVLSGVGPVFAVDFPVSGSDLGYTNAEEALSVGEEVTNFEGFAAPEASANGYEQMAAGDDAYAAPAAPKKMYPQGGITPRYGEVLKRFVKGKGWVVVERSSIDNDVLTYFKQWKQNFYKVYTKDAKGNDVGVIEGPVTGGTAEEEGIWKNSVMLSASEHTGYGMIIFSLMAGHAGDNGQCKKDFDSLVRLYLGLKRPNNLMAWIVPQDTNIFKNALKTANKANLPGSATDGDFDIAYAFLLADKQWPNDKTHGKTYKQLALDMINKGIYNDLISSETNRIMLGDWQTQGIKEKWSPNLMFNPYLTRCSDFMFDNLRAFGAASPTKKAKFDAAIAESQRIIQAFKAHNAGTGLVSDFILNDYTYKKDSSGKYVLDEEGAKIAVFGTTVIPAPQELYEPMEENFPANAYTENACRLPLRLGLDVAHTNDATSRAALTDIANFISKYKSTAHSGVPSFFMPDQIADGYWLDGRDMDWGDGHLGTHAGKKALQFVSGFCSSMIVYSSGFANSGFNYLAQTHTYGLPGETDAYFKDTLSLLNMLIISGNWWNPAI